LVTFKYEKSTKSKLPHFIIKHLGKQFGDSIHIQSGYDEGERNPNVNG